MPNPFIVFVGPSSFLWKCRMYPCFRPFASENDECINASAPLPSKMTNVWVLPPRCFRKWRKYVFFRPLFFENDECINASAPFSAGPWNWCTPEHKMWNSHWSRNIYIFRTWRMYDCFCPKACENDEFISASALWLSKKTDITRTQLRVASKQPVWATSEHRAWNSHWSRNIYVEFAQFKHTMHTFSAFIQCMHTVHL